METQKHTKHWKRCSFHSGPLGGEEQIGQVDSTNSSEESVVEEVSTSRDRQLRLSLFAWEWLLGPFENVLKVLERDFP